MTPKETRNEKLAHRMIKSLERRHFNAFYCKTSEEAVGKVLEIIPRGSSVTWDIPQGFLVRLLSVERKRHKRGRGDSEHRRKRQPRGCDNMGTEERDIRHRHEQGGTGRSGCTGKGTGNGKSHKRGTLRHRHAMYERRCLSQL